MVGGAAWWVRRAWAAARRAQAVAMVGGAAWWALMARTKTTMKKFVYNSRVVLRWWWAVSLSALPAPQTHYFGS
jgi:hypothetical protein